MTNKLFVFLCVMCSLSLYGQGKTDYLDSIVDRWHHAASVADSNYFFDFMAEDAVYLGTAPGERWSKKQFRGFALPYFRKKDAWSFKPLKRNWSFNADSTVVWFDEIIDTWMEKCRSTGVLIKKKQEWKLTYYHLSVMIENEKIKKFIELRKHKVTSTDKD